MFKFKNVWLLLVLLFPLQQAWGANLTDIEFSSLTGDRTELRLSFANGIPSAKSYSVEKPARISIDLENTLSEVEKYYQIGTGNTRSATIVSAGDRTRLIINLTQLVPYSLSQDGSQIVILVGESFTDEEPVKSLNVASNDTGADEIVLLDDSSDSGDISIIEDDSDPSGSTIQLANSDVKIVENVDFRRGAEGEGQVIITFSNSAANADIQDVSGKIQVEVPGFELPAQLQRRLDVVDFATAVQFIDAYNEGNNSVFVIEPTGFFEYLAYQTDRTLVVDIKQLTQEDQEKRRKEKFPYTGEKLSLNFQDIAVRSVLQLIADFTGLNLVASDTISGNITLRLKNVPWDQALDLVLKTKGLDKRQNGNVLLVAPAEEIAAREKLELETNSQIEKLAPLVTEFIQINYAKAADIESIIRSQSTAVEGEDGAISNVGGLLSSRGRIAIDDRTNTLMIQDTSNNLERIREAIAIFDVPVRQVLIEARIVVARSTVGEDLGIQWGGGAHSARYSVNNPGAANQSGFTGIGSGSIGGVTSVNNQLVTGTGNFVEFPEALAVDLPVNEPDASTFAVGFTGLDYVLALELSALESKGNAEIVSQPKILTADGQKANILSGTEIPYITTDGVEFRRAVLELSVRPHITPDNRFVMDLNITQDSVGDIIQGAITINTNQLNTQVLVDNGETIVLGGIFQSSEIDREDKTPFLGDLPYVGRLFKRTSKSEEKNELLVFITPKLVEDKIAGR